jgi:hypothetical protein
MAASSTNDFDIMKTSILPVLLLLAACGKSSDHAPAAPAAPAPAPTAAVAPAATPAPAAEPAKAPLGKEARDKLVADATKGFKHDLDKASGMDYYTVKDVSIYKDKLSTYISVPDQGAALLRVVIANQGRTDFDSMKVMADGATVLQKDFPTQQVQRGENASGKFETTDFVALPTDVLALEKIADAKKVVVQLSGKGKDNDLPLSAKALGDLRDTLKAYAALDALKQ